MSNENINTNLLIKNKQPEAERFTKTDDDDNALRWGRDRHIGFKVGKYIQSVPMFFSQDGHNLHICDKYKGRSAFLVCSGPSLKTLDLTKLNQPGIITMGLNNSIKVYRSKLWCSVDSPSSFIRSIWLDPTIEKYVPLCHTQKKLFDSDAWKFMDIKVGDCPNVVYYRRNEKFQAKQWLFEDKINWGNSKHHGGGRSVMLAAVRILFLLGIRKLYLIGCDMNMDEKNQYAFEQSRTNSSIKGNQSTYEKLNKWFTELVPYFEKENFSVFNCNPNSGLKSFPFVDYETALRRIHNENGNIDYKNENTAGLYSTKDEEKKQGKKVL